MTGHGARPRGAPTAARATQYVPISTRGGPSCHVQNTDTRSAPEENSTRIHDSVFHTCIDQPAPGVAETSEAEVFPRSKTARPPSVS